MRKVVQLGVVAFAIALGVGAGYRLSAEAMAVVVGVVCGVLASVPVSIMVLILTRRLNKPSRSRESTPEMQSMAYPPVVVIQPDGRGYGKQQAAPSWNPPPATENQPWRRAFTVVGEEGDW